MLVFGHLGFTLVAARLLAPLVPAGKRVPMPALVVGALLPDLIDKPLGHLILGWGNGRLWAHALVFVLALAALAWALRSQLLATLTFGAGVHQLLDRMPWTDLAAWLWPSGGGFPRGVSAGVPDWIAALLNDPYLWVTEAIGLVALVILLVAPYLGLAPTWWRRPTPVEAATRALDEGPRPGETDT